MQATYKKQYLQRDFLLIILLKQVDECLWLLWKFNNIQFCDRFAIFRLYYYTRREEH